MTIFRKVFVAICIVMLIIPFHHVNAANFPSQTSSSGGTQIVFLVDGADITLTDISISGTNQYGQPATWKKSDQNGFQIAYTKDWWWIQDFVKINFTYKDLQTKQSVSDYCLIDALAQPVDVPRVEIVYFKGIGCQGGDAGSAIDPISDKVKPIQTAFGTIEYYLSDFNTEVFLETFAKVGVNATVCAVSIGAALETGGLTYAAMAASTTNSCEKAGEEAIKSVFKQP